MKRKVILTGNASYKVYVFNLTTVLEDATYTFEFVEKREFPVDLVDEGSINFEKERELLWDEVHAQVDKQVQDVVEVLKQGR